MVFRARIEAQSGSATLERVWSGCVDGGELLWDGLKATQLHNREDSLQDAWDSTACAA